MLDCWYMDDSQEDQRKPHRQDPNVPATADALHALGVVSWTLDADTFECDPKLEAIRKVRAFSVSLSDFVVCGYSSNALLKSMGCATGHLHLVLDQSMCSCQEAHNMGINLILSMEPGPCDECQFFC
jgi:hypothetical protein